MDNKYSDIVEFSLRWVAILSPDNATGVNVTEVLPDGLVYVSDDSSMGGSQILLETNEQMSVYDLFKGIAVASGNDAVVAMAEKIAGTEEVMNYQDHSYLSIRKVYHNLQRNLWDLL